MPIHDTACRLLSMRDSDRSKPGTQRDPKAELPATSGVSGPNSRPTPKPAKQEVAPDAKPSGRVVHDERGNAVWNWVVETGRIFVGNTSRMLRKLETPELKMEDEQQQELRLESDRDAGGGYDPYASSSGRKNKR
jgi:hypothetical protein